MPKNARAEPAHWWPAVWLAVVLVTGGRIALLAFNRTDLFVDEAQYWLWGQDLALGYYSKPPLIGWVIRLSTEIGNNSPFWIRLPGPVLHGLTALILAATAARQFGARTALPVALAWLTLPMVAVASLLISTDSVMLPCLALALAAYLRAVEAPTQGTAIAFGVALGLGFMGKYAAVFLLFCLPIAAVFLPRARLPVRWLAMAAACFVIVIAPNVIWNALNGFSTVQHTLDNTEWVRAPGSTAHPDPLRVVEFLAAQFGVFGPVLFGALLWLGLRARQAPAPVRLLLLTSLPILALVCTQAFLSKAYANWGVATYIAGTLAVVPWLIDKPRALWASYAINGLLCLALPLATLWPTFTIAGRQPLERYIGRADMSHALIDTAKAAGLAVIVSENRDLLADLFYTGRDSGLAFHAMPQPGRPLHHYAQKHPLPAGLAGDVLFASALKPACAGAALATIRPETGAWRGKTITAYRVPANCWARP